VFFMAERSVFILLTADPQSISTIAKRMSDDKSQDVAKFPMVSRIEFATVEL